MLIARRIPFWMFSPAVGIATRNPFGVGATPMPITPRYSFWMSSRAMAFSCGHNPLARRISHIIRTRTQKQVENAQSVIPSRTIVADKQPFWNWTVFEFPRDAMRAHTLVQFGNPDRSVAATGGTSPEPTTMRTARLVYLRPEPFGKWDTCMRVYPHDRHIPMLPQTHVVHTTVATALDWFMAIRHGTGRRREVNHQLLGVGILREHLTSLLHRLEGAMGPGCYQQSRPFNVSKL